MEKLIRYSNRKIYSKTLSKYVTLDYVADLVRTNQRFQVLKHETGEDITKKTLHSCITKLDLDTETVVNLIRSK